MFGHKGKYSTLEGDSQLQNVSKERDGSQKVNRKPAIVLLAVVCVIILVVVIVVPIVVVNNTHENNDNEGLQCPEAEGARVDCYPEKDENKNEDTCHSRGCCWVAGGSPGAPLCFYPSNYGYNVMNVSDTNVGVTAHVQKDTDDSKLPYRDEIKQLKVEAYYETDERLRIKVCAVFYFISVLLLYVCIRSLIQKIRDMRCPVLTTMYRQRKQTILFTHLNFRDPNVVTTSPSLCLAIPIMLQCECDCQCAYICMLCCIH